MNRNLPNTFLLSTLALFAGGKTANAQLLGTSVTGSLQFPGQTINFFDPGNGTVPDGYLNKTQGYVVTVAEPATEFGFVNGLSTGSINITDTAITLTNIDGRGGLRGGQYTLTDLAFAGRTFTAGPDGFDNGGVIFSQSGDVISIYTVLGLQGTHTVTFSVNPAAVPEPGSSGLCISLIVGAAGVCRRWRR